MDLMNSFYERAKTLNKTILFRKELNPVRLRLLVKLRRKK